MLAYLYRKAARAQPLWAELMCELGGAANSSLRCSRGAERRRSPMCGRRRPRRSRRRGPSRPSHARRRTPRRRSWCAATLASSIASIRSGEHSQRCVRVHGSMEKQVAQQSWSVASGTRASVRARESPPPSAAWCSSMKIVATRVATALRRRSRMTVADGSERSDSSDQLLLPSSEASAKISVPL